MIFISKLCVLITFGGAHLPSRVHIEKEDCGSYVSAIYLQAHVSIFFFFTKVAYNNEQLMLQMSKRNRESTVGSRIIRSRTYSERCKDRSHCNFDRYYNFCFFFFNFSFLYFSSFSVKNIDGSRIVAVVRYVIQSRFGEMV